LTNNYTLTSYHSDMRYQNQNNEVQEGKVLTSY